MLGLCVIILAAATVIYVGLCFVASDISKAIDKLTNEIRSLKDESKD